MESHALNVKVELRSTFTFTRGLLFKRVKFTFVLTEKLRDRGNQPLYITVGNVIVVCTPCVPITVLKLGSANHVLCCKRFCCSFLFTEMD